MKKIKLAIIDESLSISKYVIQKFNNYNAIEIVGKIYDLRTAIKKIADLEPNVVIVNFEMTSTTGADFISELFGKIKVPIVAVSTNSEDEKSAIKAGAVNFVVRPADALADKSEFLNKLLMETNLASVQKFTHPIVNIVPQVIAPMNKKGNNIIAIGASTGGTEAILRILKGIERGGVPPIVVVQHMPAGFTKTYSERLNNECNLDVKEVENNDLLIPDRVLIAAGEYHLRVKRLSNNSLIASSVKGEKVSSHCPSVDVMFESIVKACNHKDNVMAIILTGMGKDGAIGLLHLRQKNAYTVGQDEASSIVYGMPMEAYNIGAVTKQVPLSEISKEINNWISKIRNKK